jgi:hypothetical protein
MLGLWRSAQTHGRKSKMRPAPGCSIRSCAPPCWPGWRAIVRGRSDDRGAGVSPRRRIDAATNQPTHRARRLVHGSLSLSCQRHPRWAGRSAGGGAQVVARPVESRAERTAHPGETEYGKKPRRLVHPAPSRRLPARKIFPPVRPAPAVAAFTLGLRCRERRGRGTGAPRPRAGVRPRRPPAQKSSVVVRRQLRGSFRYTRRTPV